MNEVAIGLIGTGFMGKCHALAFRAAPAVFGGLPALRLEMLADVGARIVELAAHSWGFARWTTDWHEVTADPAIDLVAITTPNHLHEPMALAAIAAKKHVYCEKPLATSAAAARTMAEAAKAAGVKTLVGYNYLRSPAVALAKELIEGGEIGEVRHFRGAHFEDYMADPATPCTWRHKKACAGGGALVDLGSHVVSLARHLVGEIAETSGGLSTVITHRPVAGAPDELDEVDVDDHAEALLRFACGATGTLEASWLAWGRKMTLCFEITGGKGTIAFDQERMNELHLFTHGDRRRLDGFRTVLMGPEHPRYAAFCPAPGHQLGFNDLKVIEVRALIEGIAHDAPLEPDFDGGWRIARVVDAIRRSASERRWVRCAEV